MNIHINIMVNYGLRAPNKSNFLKGRCYHLKNRVAAGVLGILLGGLGIHKFYLGQIGQGIVYLLFCWTGIPGIIGLIEGILYLVKSDEEFNEKYGNKNANSPL
jgi:TM2 domain-containing membrane protein YozV